MVLQRTETVNIPRLRFIAYFVVFSGLMTVVCAYASQSFQYQFAWGTSGTGDGQLSSPHGVAVDGLGEVYVADSYNHRVQVFSDTGGYQRQWALTSSYGQMALPFGIRRSGGSILVCDAALARVQEFTPGGTLVRSWGTYGTGVGQLNGPMALDCDATGNVYVADTYNWRMQVFSPTGTYLWGWFGVQGHQDVPAGVACDAGSTIYLNDSIHMNVFGNTGQLTGSWSPFDPTIGARGMDIAADGHLFVADAGNSVVREYLPDGTFVQTFGSYGSGPGQFGYDSPSDVACGPNGLIYVCDRANNRIEVFGPSTSPVAPTTWGAIKALYAK